MIFVATVLSCSTLLLPFWWLQYTEITLDIMMFRTGDGIVGALVGLLIWAAHINIGLIIYLLTNQTAI